MKNQRCEWLCYKQKNFLTKDATPTLIVFFFSFSPLLVLPQRPLNATRVTNKFQFARLVCKHLLFDSWSLCNLFVSSLKRRATLAYIRTWCKEWKPDLCLSPEERWNLAKDSEVSLSWNALLLYVLLLNHAPPPQPPPPTTQYLHRHELNDETVRNAIAGLRISPLPLHPHHPRTQKKKKKHHCLDFFLFILTHPTSHVYPVHIWCQV